MNNTHTGYNPYGTDDDYAANPGAGHRHQSEDKGRHGASWVDHINDYVGNDKPADLNWRVLFTDVMKHHTTAEAEEIFICGTARTTPASGLVSRDWPHPWLYSRVFFAFVMAFTLLWVCCVVFQNVNTLPGLIVVGSFTVPLATMVLFLELNAWRNISVYEVIKTFLVGGCASLVATLTIYSFVGIHDLDFIGAFITGLVEETGKAIIVYVFLRRLGHLRILSAMLIGAAVGAGFAAFESSGYAMQLLLENGWETMMGAIFLRGFLTPGGHVTWAAISGAALVIAARSAGGLSLGIFGNRKFLRLFIIPVALHGLWDSPLAAIGSSLFLVPTILTALVWVVIMILINMGLSEVSRS